MMPPFNIVLSTWMRVHEIVPNEGLIVLLADLIKELSRQGIRIRIYLLTRHVRTLADALTANGLPRQSYELIDFDVSPRSVKIWSWVRRQKTMRLSFGNRVSKFVNRTRFPRIRALVWKVSHPPTTAKASPSNRIQNQSRSSAAGIIRLVKRLATFSHRLMDSAFALESMRLAREINRQSDVKVVFAPFAFNGELLSLIDWPKLVVFPDFVASQFPSRFLGHVSKRDRMEYSKSISSADAIVCYSQAVAERQLQAEFAEEAAAKPIHVIPQGFFPARTEEEAGDERIAFKNFFSESFCSYLPKYDIKEIDYIVYPSVDRPHKNMVTLVRAVDHLIRKRHRNIKMITTSHLMSADTAGVIEAKRLFVDCLFAPSLTESELATLIRHARLVVHPSLAEGGDIFNFSRGVSVGVPVLMSDIPMAREMFERYGIADSVFQDWLFPPTNHLVLAEMIEQGLQERDALLREQAAVLKELQHYDYAAMAKRYYEAYLALAP